MVRNNELHNHWMGDVGWLLKLKSESVVGVLEARSLQALERSPGKGGELLLLKCMLEDFNESSPLS